MQEKIYKKKLLFNSNKGMTLVEILITVSLFTILGTMMILSVANGKNFLEYNQVQNDLQENMRLASDWIKEDLRQASSSSILDVPAHKNKWYSTITFRTPTGIDSNGNLVWPTETIQYDLGGKSSTDLLRTIEDGVTVISQRTIVENISLIQFRRVLEVPEVVEVQIQGQKKVFGKNTISMNTSFKVRVRN